ncbi:hypothetical protein DFH08DRAFT_1084833 [Mycena albidolilacea]|uniref:Uncharacterized protein n=1 Tax=Mycena albidolilacea TaxID=1033008 RepID=A0AAD7EJ36_9AGAR|nr:hypothetical protein DFH08DRAFT_1084833 [Mycena albidolilacea]
MPTFALTPIFAPPEDPGSIEHEVDANGMDEAGRILVNNMKFMTALEFIFAAPPLVAHRVPPDSMVPARNMIPPLICICDGDALPHAVFAPGNPIPTICTFIGCWTPRCVALLVVQHRVPPDSMVPAESMLVQINVHLAAEKSCTDMHTICHNNALPRAIFAPGNPIPAVCTFIGCWTPRCVGLWQELTRFHDVLDALDSVLFALRTLWRFVREAIDVPGRFREKQVLLQNFARDFILDVNKSGFG